MRATREFFDYGDRTIARVRDGRIIPATAEYLTDAIGRHVRFERTVQQRNKSFVQIACDTPRAVGRTILERHGERRLPKLTAVITAPLMRADGSLLTAPGHDPESGLYLAPDGSYDDRIPESPTLAEVVDAIAELWRPVADFPLEDSVSRGVLLAALLTAVVRPSLDTSPAFAIDAPTWGSGKTLLAKVISALAGVNFEPMAPPHDDEEAFKSLFAEFRAGARVICWDNLTQPLNGQKMSALAMLLTAPVFKGRVLGQTETVGVPNRAVFLVTGNNIVVTGDVMRRILVARITPPEERPELRSFAVDPLDMVRRERQRLVRSALVILRGYLTIREPQNRHCGPPTGAGHGSGLASYDQWNSLVRQAVVWLAREVPCGIDLDDPILSVTRNAEADPDGAHLVSMLVGCREAFGARWFTAADVIRDVTFPDGLTPTLVRAIESQREINPGFNERHLGKWLSNRRERIKGGLRFAGEPDPHSKVMRWRVEKCRQPTIAEA
jgi:hypothetical protein